MGEERFAKPAGLANEMVQWTISSDERRELGRAAGELLKRAMQAGRKAGISAVRD